MAKKYGVNLTLLIIVGYVTETEEDHQAQLEWIRNNREFADNPVKLVQVGSTLSILPGTWLDQHRNELGIVMGSDTIYQDWTRPEIGSTPEVRMRWHKETIEELEKNGFTPAFAQDNHKLIESYIENTYGSK